ncbi:MAG: hypothetical protein ACI84K_001778 [Pseudohongiellaceae bacterium]|jgi:hypothetical protein
MTRLITLVLILIYSSWTTADSLVNSVCDQNISLVLFDSPNTLDIDEHYLIPGSQASQPKTFSRVPVNHYITSPPRSRPLILYHSRAPPLT